MLYLFPPNSMSTRRQAPVFVMGSPRSGTTYFYHLLLSAGDFALYRTEARVFDMLEPRFGDLRKRGNRKALLDAWLPSEFFRRSGLDAAEFRSKALDGFSGAGELLKLLMESICAAQGARRWAECTPMNVLYMEEIKRAFPDALFIHMIRDGRDVALSYAKQGWMRPLPWDRKRTTLAAGLYWQWLVEHGQRNGRSVAPGYMEVRFEELNARPRDVLARVGEFIEHDLDYDRILKVGYGSVSAPNTSFSGDLKSGAFNPVGRWKSGYTHEQLVEFEAIIGPFLSQLGYELSQPRESLRASPGLELMAAMYRSQFSIKHWLKTTTPLGRLTDISLLRDFHSQDQERLAEESS
jgi:hypothetical protein